MRGGFKDVDDGHEARQHNKGRAERHTQNRPRPPEVGQQFHSE